ncbi:hypothetical protein HG548_18860 [Citrobacter sp. DNRA3]|nr:hypothetical protein [Citrobacter sp. DNRA3]
MSSNTERALDKRLIHVPNRSTPNVLSIPKILAQLIHISLVGKFQQVYQSV